jgi:hypothetical protein
LADAPDYALNLPLRLMAVIHIAQPSACDLEQLRDIIAQRSFQVFYVCRKTRPKALGYSKVIQANRLAQAIHPLCEQLNPVFKIAGHSPARPGE